MDLGPNYRSILKNTLAWITEWVQGKEFLLNAGGHLMARRHARCHLVAGSLLLSTVLAFPSSGCSVNAQKCSFHCPFVYNLGTQKDLGYHQQIVVNKTGTLMTWLSLLILLYLLCYRNASSSKSCLKTNW